jgi:hypothetical protein
MSGVRIRGRRLYPSTMAQRRLMLSLGSYPFYVPRGISPFLVARKLSRAAQGQGPEQQFLREVLAKGSKPKSVPSPSEGDAAPTVAA